MPFASFRAARFRLLAIACGACALALPGCGSFDSASRNIASWVTPYKIEIVQGNFVSREQVEALKPGMPRAQVRDILGTPLLTDVFHANRWDYVFTMKRRGVKPIERKLTVFFNGDMLDRFDSDEMPAEAEFVATLDTGRKPAKPPVLEATEEKLEKFAPQPGPKTGESLADPVQTAPLPSSYPPLEVPGRGN